MYKILSIFTAAIIVAAAVSATSFAYSKVDISGKWDLSADAGGQTVVINTDIKQDGETFSGTVSSEHGSGTLEGGKLTGDKVSATMKVSLMGQPTEIAMTGTTDGKTMSGSLNVPGFGELPFTGARPK